MAYVFYIIISLVMLIFQTVILSIPLFIHASYDLMLILILYVGLFRPLSEGMAIGLLMGIFMDALSGGTFWTYTTTYFWFLVILKWMIQFLNAGSVILLPFTILLGIIFENMIFLLSSVGMDVSSWISSDTIQIICSQTVWGVVTGPAILLFIKKVHEDMGVAVWSGERSKRTTSSGGIEEGGV